MNDLVKIHLDSRSFMKKAISFLIFLLAEEVGLELARKYLFEHFDVCVELN